MRVAVVGKGGAGKSVVAGTLARVLARRGERVLALDSDTMPGLALTLGVPTSSPPPLMAAAEKGEDGRWRLAPGMGPVRAVQRFAYDGPDGLRLLEFGKLGPGGRAELMPAMQAFWRVVRGVGQARALQDWSIVGDLPAGPRQLAYDWAPYARTILVVAEPTMQSLLTARRLVRLAASRPGPAVELVASKVTGRSDLERIERFLGAPALAAIPRDPAVVSAERAGLPLFDHAPDSPAVRAVEALAAGLADQRRDGAASGSRGSATNSS